MWYFSWILGVVLAMACGVINVLWLEAEYFCKIDIEEAARGKRS
jgi:cyd operon protein YbgT